MRGRAKTLVRMLARTMFSPQTLGIAPPMCKVASGIDRERTFTLGCSITTKYKGNRWRRSLHLISLHALINGRISPNEIVLAVGQHRSQSSTYNATSYRLSLTILR